MKSKRLILLLAFAAFPTFAAYQQQWFSQFQEFDGNMSFSCTNQCFALIGPFAGSDYATLQWTFQGDGVVGYGFLVWQQVVPGETIQVNGSATVDQQFSFNKLQFYSQIPADAQLVFVVQGNITWLQVGMQIGVLSFFEKFGNGFKQALEYKEYTPRTINFLEGPMRNGKYINQAFFWRIVVFLLAAVIRYFFSTDKKQKKNALYFWIGVLVFFWLLFDLFSTVNQVKIYNQTMSATNIMENGRVGRSSDFYQFLDFIKTKVPTWEKWAFIASYPFEFEGKYHIYPDVKFDVVTWVKYIFFYNPYGAQAPFDFKDPIYSGGVLTWKDLTFPVEEEIIRQPHAKIYILKK